MHAQILSHSLIQIRHSLETTFSVLQAQNINDDRQATYAYATWAADMGFMLTLIVTPLAVTRETHLRACLKRERRAGKVEMWDLPRVLDGLELRKGSSHFHWGSFRCFPIILLNDLVYLEQIKTRQRVITDTDHLYQPVRFEDPGHRCTRAGESETSVLPWVICFDQWMVSYRGIVVLRLLS